MTVAKLGKSGADTEFGRDLIAAVEEVRISQLRVIQADFVNWRPVTGRKVLQLVFETDIMNTQEVLEKLGTPQPGESKWVAIALLDTKLVREASPATPTNGENKVSDSSTATQAEHSEAAPPKKSWGELSRANQCGILCSDENFRRYVKVNTPVEAAEFVRSHFRIDSRTDLNSGENAARWDEFVALFHLHRDRLK